MSAGETLHRLLLGLLQQPQDGLLPLSLEEGGDVGGVNPLTLRQDVGALDGS